MSVGNTRPTFLFIDGSVSYSDKISRILDIFVKMAVISVAKTRVLQMAYFMRTLKRNKQIMFNH